MVKRCTTSTTVTNITFNQIFFNYYHYCPIPCTIHTVRPVNTLTIFRLSKPLATVLDLAVQNVWLATVQFHLAIPQDSPAQLVFLFKVFYGFYVPYYPMMLRKSH